VVVSARGRRVSVKLDVLSCLLLVTAKPEHLTFEHLTQS
jgi:hypothetical protein